MTTRILSVFGTRPEAIKMAPVVLQLASDPRFDACVCVTGQHRALLDSVLDSFAIAPDFDLDVMSPGQDLAQSTSRVLQGVHSVIDTARPDIVLVHGDTTTTLAASLAAFYARVPVGHVEAGLRSNDMSQPFPEELNRRVTDLVSALHFAPTERARANLLAEGVDAASIHVTGNTVIDALRIVRARIGGWSPEQRAAALGPRFALLVEGWPGPIVLVTGHRRENFGDGIDGVCRAVAEAAVRHRDWLFVYPVHPNPRVKGPVTSALGCLENVALVEPLDYEPFVFLMERSAVIVTDSGGVQEEAHAMGKRTLVTRAVTERGEALAAHGAELVGTDPLRIQGALEDVFLDAAGAGAPAAQRGVFGDGHAAERIVAVLARYLAAEPLMGVGA